MKIIGMINLLLGVSLLLAGCGGEEDTVEKNAALLITCNAQAVYIWHDKLYYRERNGTFRQVIATKNDVCTKFKENSTTTAAPLD